MWTLSELFFAAIVIYVVWVFLDCIRESFFDE